jgi:hypothetical protein
MSCGSEVVESLCFEQQLRGDFDCEAARRDSQQEGFLFAVVVQQAMSIPAAFAWASANAGGTTPCWRAQAIRSASEWQQQERQHWLAVRQPQPELAQGNCSLLFPSPFFFVPAGSGTPVAVTMNALSNTKEMPRR